MPRVTPIPGPRALSGPEFAEAINGVFAQAIEIDAAIQQALRLICEVDGWEIGQAWMPRADSTALEWRTAWVSAPHFLDFCETSRAIVCAPDVGMPGRAWATREPVAVLDVALEPDFYRTHAAESVGLRSAAAVPLCSDHSVMAVLEFFDTQPRTPVTDLAALAKVMGPPLAGMLDRRREQAQRESEERIRGLFDSPTIGIVFWDRNGRVVDANQAFLNTVGFTREEMLHGAVNWERLSPPDERLDEWVFRQIEATGVCPPFEKECVRKDGMRVPVLLGGSFAPASSCAIGYVFNVTEQRRIADALRESEERFRAFMDNSPAVAFMKDAAGRHVYFNAVWERVFDLSSASALGRTDAEMFPAPVAAQVRENDRTVLAAGRPMEFWERVPSADGVMREWLVLKFPFEPASGRKLLGGVALDMTERRRMEAALHDSEERYRNLVEHSPDAIFLINADRVTYVNHAAVRLLSAAGPEDIVGRSAFDFVHADHKDMVRDRLRQLGEGRHLGTPAEQRWVRMDGTALDVEVFAIPMRDRESTLQIVARDIAERKQAERERARLLALEQEARAQSEALSRKLVDAQESERRHIARELHDEIGQMLTGLSLILKSGSPPPTPWKQRYSDAQKLLHDLTRHVREMSLDLRPAMLDDLGLLAALLWQLERYTYQTGVQIHFHHVGLDRRFPAELETAAYRFVQEALTNVARHAKTREAEVRVRANPAMLWVRISDQGVGFDPGRNGMTGSIGLVGMRERVSSLGGELQVDSSPGQGTSLTAWLPLPSSESSEGS